MKRNRSRISSARPLRVALATTLLSLSIGAVLAVPASDGAATPVAFEQDFPTGEPAPANVAQPEASIAEYTDNQMSEALFAEPEVVMLLMKLAGIDPLQSP